MINHLEVVELATEQLRKSGRFNEQELGTYAAVMSALHEEAALPKPDMKVMGFLGEQLAAVSAKSDPYEGLTRLLQSGELREWIKMLDGDLPTGEMN